MTRPLLKLYAEGSNLDEQMVEIRDSYTHGKPCPKCGGRAILHANPALREEYRYSVECEKCGNDYPGGALSYGETARQAIDRWNARELFNFDTMTHQLLSKGTPL